MGLCHYMYCFPLDLLYRLFPARLSYCNYTYNCSSLPPSFAVLDHACILDCGFLTKRLGSVAFNKSIDLKLCLHAYLMYRSWPVND